MAMQTDKVIEAYLKVRAQKEALKKKHTEEMAPLNEAMFKLASWLQKQLQETGQTSAKTPAGTAFLQTDVSVAVEDFDAILAFIRSHDLWVMLEKRVSKSVVQDYIASTNEVPPGVKVSSEISCHVRRPS